MDFIKLLLNLGLNIILATVFCTTTAEIIQRLPNNTIPFHYKIILTLHLEEDNFTFHGESNVNIGIQDATLNIILHSRELEINETATTLIDNEGTVYKPKKHIHNNVTDILTLNFENALLPDYYTLNMKFIGIIPMADFVKRGIMIFPYTNEKGNSLLAATIFEPNGARRVFPCWDEPTLKATFDISVMHHQKYMVLSNMPIIEQHCFFEEYGTNIGMMQTHFDTTLIMSTYLVAIVVIPRSDYVRVSNTKKTVNMWCRSSVTSQIAFAHDIAKKVIPLLTKYINISEKIPKMNHVLIPSLLVDGMENWGLITYKESILIYDDSKHPTYKRIEIATAITHKLVHQWFGNLITPSWWSYMWLKEGFAIFIQTYLMNKIFESWRMDYFVVKTLHISLMRDVDVSISVTTKHDIFQSEHLYFFVVYDKAPVLLRMLRNTITDEVFRKGLITYVATHEYKSTTPDDLWSSMQSALDESEVPHKDYKIKEVMDTWINQESYPEVNVIRNYKTGEVILSQKCIYGRQIDKCINNKWWIPITFATQSNPNFTNTVPKYWLRPNQNNISFIINPHDWIIVNVQQTGYYRVNYDVKNWKKISNYLNLDTYTNIHVLNRAQIINDLYIFMEDRRNRRINGFIFIELIRYLNREIDYVAWQPMFQIVSLWQHLLVLPEATLFRQAIGNLFGRLLQRMGYLENNDDDIEKLTRLEAIKWACNFGNNFCQYAAAIQLSQHLAEPDLYTLPPERKFIYCTGMMAANRTIWKKMLDLYQKTDLEEEKISLLNSLSCSNDPDIIINYLNIITFNISLFHDKERFLAFMSILEKHSSNDLVLDYILQNFDTVKPRSVPTAVTIKHILLNVYSNKQVDKVKRFSEMKFNQDPDTLFAIKASVENREYSLETYLSTLKRQFV